MNKKILALAAASLFSTTIVSAESNWTGLKVGIGVGSQYDQAKTTVDGSHDLTAPFHEDPNTDNFTGNASGTNDLGKTKFIGTLDASYDYQMNKNFVMGLIGSYDFGSKKTMGGSAAGLSDWDEGSSSGHGDARITTIFNTKNTAALGLRLGALANESTLVYAAAGWTNTKYNQSATYASHAKNNDYYPYDYTSSLSKNGHKNGYFLGGGLETKFTDRISGKLEYRYSNFGRIKASQNLSLSGIETGANYWDAWGGDQFPMSGSSSLIHNTNLTSHAIRAVLSYDF
jgi:outer membrane immunogenic protein